MTSDPVEPPASGACRASDAALSPAAYREELVRHLRAFGASAREESVPLTEASGRVLAAPLAAPEPSPRFANSQMDGYAISELRGGRFVVGPEIPAGTDPQQLPGKSSPQTERSLPLAWPVMTGSRLPEGTHAVLPVERAEPPEFLPEGAVITVPSLESGAFVREAGSDVAEGAELAPAGTVLTPPLIALAAQLGWERLPVRARPRLLVVTGGEEIVETGARPGPAQVRDANAVLLSALAGGQGAEVVASVRTGDDPAALARVLGEAAATHTPDLILTSGGISHGRYEVVRQLLLGSPGFWVGSVSQQPGGPQCRGSYEGLPVIGLPGNPVSTWVSFRMLLAPALAEAFGAVPPPRPVMARMAAAAEGIDGRTQFRRGRLEPGEGGGWESSESEFPALRPPALTATAPRAVLLGGPGSHLLAQGALAEALIEIPPGARLAPGDPVVVHPL